MIFCRGLGWILLIWYSTLCWNKEASF